MVGNRKMVVGLIGGIGSGKSVVAEAFAQRGGRVVSGDKAGHEALRDRGIRQQLVGHFGAQVLDEKGEIDRRRLGVIVFADASQRRALEAIVFPYIERRLEEDVAAARADPRADLIVLDAAIMLEAGWNKICDKLVFIEAPPDTRLER